MKVALFKLTILLVPLFVLGGVGYWFYSNEAGDVKQPIKIPSSETTALSPSHVPEGWQVYISDDKWGNGGRVALAYPPGWTLEEERATIFEGQPREYTRLEKVTLSGGGHRIAIHQKGRGASPDWTTRDIGGYSARMWQSDLEEGHHFIFGVIDAGFILEVTTPSKNTNFLNEFISTVMFEKQP